MLVDLISLGIAYAIIEPIHFGALLVRFYFHLLSKYF